MDKPLLAEINADAIGQTHAALHAYARVIGALLKATRPRRKHWWHASLRPSLRGLSTGIVYADTNFELELDLIHSRLRISNAGHLAFSERLSGQPASHFARVMNAALEALGVTGLRELPGKDQDKKFDGYIPEQAALMHSVLALIARTMHAFRAGLREETSPVQVWPHHFDLSMIWLPGGKVKGADPGDEEKADKQLNFGFVFGDENIREPYCYVTAYPQVAGMETLDLPGPARWHSEGFQGVVVPYGALRNESDPASYLQRLWAGLVDACRSELSK